MKKILVAYDGGEAAHRALDLAAGGFQQRGKHFDGGCLPCPVGSEEGEDFSFGHIEGDVVDSSECAEGFDKVLDADHGESSGKIQY